MESGFKEKRDYYNVYLNAALFGMPKACAYYPNVTAVLGVES